MSRKQQAKTYNKFYHNDIKKQLGIDQSRTASQKLLDKVIKVDQRADFKIDHQSVQFSGQAKKKIKTQTQNLTNKQILQTKLFKNIQNQPNISKLLKSLTILKKCLNQESFLSDPEINFIETWEIYTYKLMNQITERNYCSGESLNIMGNIGECLQILFKKFGNRKLATKNNEEGQVQQDQKISQNLKKEEIFVCFCRLFTDDSFVFNKNLSKLKSFIFSHCQSPSKQIKQQSRSIVFNLITKLVTMPIKYDWAYTSLVNLFKEFNNQGFQNEFSSQEEKKNILKSFNELLNRKPKSSGTAQSFNIMGSSKQSTSVKTVYIETNLQSGSDRWVSKQ